MSTTTPLAPQADTLTTRLGLDHPDAQALATLPPDARRRAATHAAADRRAELALYALAYGERYGIRVNTADVEAHDDLLAELLILAIA